MQDSNETELDRSLVGPRKSRDETSTSKHGSVSIVSLSGPRAMSLLEAKAVGRSPEFVLVSLIDDKPEGSMKEQRARTKAAGNFQSIGAIALQAATLLEQLRGISGARATVETYMVTVVFRAGFTEVLLTCLAVVIAMMVWSAKKQKAAESIPVVESEPIPEQPWEVIRVVDTGPPMLEKPRGW